MPAATTCHDDREAILQLGKEWEEAVGSRDLDRILSLVTEDVVFLPHGSASIAGKQAVRETYRALFARYSIQQTFAPEEIQIGGDWAFTRGADLLTLVPLDGGVPIVIRARGISILKRGADGAWKFARGISNLDQPPDAVSGGKPG
jgi:uncharacterized protein (TIGR02246 family)